VKDFANSINSWSPPAMPAGSSRFDAVNQLDLLWDRLNCGSAGKRVPCFAAMLEKITLQLAPAKDDSE